MLLKKQGVIAGTFLVALVAPHAFASCEMSDLQEAKVRELLKKHQQNVTQAVSDIVGRPAASKDAACLDNLKNIRTDMFVINPASLLDTLFEQVVDELMAMACQAVTDKWNESVEQLAIDVELPLDLGGVAITTSSSGWGGETAAPSMHGDDVKFAGKVGVNGTTVDTGGAGMTLTPPAFGTRASAINNDISESFVKYFK